MGSGDGIEERQCQLTPRGDLLASSGNTDDNGLAPALVTSLESGTHDLHVTSAIKCVVTAAVRHLDQLVLDRLALLQLRRVYEVCSTKLLAPGLLRIIYIHHDDLGRAVLYTPLDNRQTNATGTKYGNVGTLLDAALAGRNGGGAVARGDTAAEQTGTIHTGLLLRDGHDGDIGDDGVLGEGRGAHKVQQVLALALEARGAVRHEALALRGANLAAQIGLARLAKLALLALRGAVMRVVLAFFLSWGESGYVLPRRVVVAMPSLAEGARLILAK